MHKTSYSIKMLMKIFSLFGVFGICELFHVPPPEVCTSTNESVECICKNRENLTISSNLNFNIRLISVEGCGVVTVPYSAITHLQMDSFLLTDIDQLNIQPFALFSVQEINLFKIENIRKLKVREHGFVGLYNVSNIIIRNVSSSSLPVTSFGGVSNINNFLIENSNFGEVEESAFIVTNVTNFTLSNCKFHIIRNLSFLIHNVESVQFDNCTFEETTNNSFTTSFVSSLSFMNCHFGVLASTAILTKSLETFNFQECSVEKLETNAFSLVDASEKITFTHNSIEMADEYSLITSTGTYSSNRVEVENCCNSLTCDCNIFWLWDPNEEGAYNSILENSYCIGMPETNLSSLMPVLDSSNKCMTLELKILYSNAKPSIALASSAQIKVNDFKLIAIVSFLGLSLFIS